VTVPVAPPADAVPLGPAPEPAPPPPGARIDPVADKHDFAVLREDLGRDFTPWRGQNSLTVRPGTRSAAGLPENVETELSMSAWYVYGGPPRQTVCIRTVRSPRGKVCTAGKLSDGRRYLVQRPSPVIEDPMPSLTVYFVRDLHVVVQVNLTTRTQPGIGADRAVTRRWTESMITRTAATAADHRMEPWFYWPVGKAAAPPA
jgi:hypothetical protein